MHTYMYIYVHCRLKDAGASQEMQGFPKAYEILYPSQRYYWPVLIAEVGNNSKIDYSIQGLVAKLKDTVANG